MASRRAALALGSLERIARRFGPGLPARKLTLLANLAHGRLESAGQLGRLHELLCFHDAYPDNHRVRGRVRRMLREFSQRPELRRHRHELAGSGIAGTDTPYRFFWPTAQWIAEHWPGALVLDRNDEEAIREILAALPAVARACSGGMADCAASKGPGTGRPVGAARHDRRRFHHWPDRRDAR